MMFSLTFESVEQSVGRERDEQKRLSKFIQNVSFQCHKVSKSSGCTSFLKIENIKYPPTPILSADYDKHALSSMKCAHRVPPRPGTSIVPKERRSWDISTFFCLLNAWNASLIAFITKHIPRTDERICK